MKKNKLILTIIGVVVVIYICLQLFVFRFLTNRLSIGMKLPWGLSSLAGKNISLPDKYSKLLPLYPECRVISIIEGSKDKKANVTVTTRIKGDIDNIIRWHELEVKRMGYSVDQATTMDQVANIWFHNDLYKGSVTLSNKDYSHPGKITEEIRASLWLELK